MGLKVDTNSINKNLLVLDKCMKQYKENGNSLFLELAKIDDYWYGTDKIDFFNKIILEKKNFLFILDELEQIDSFYRFVENIYEKYNNGEKK